MSAASIPFREQKEHVQTRAGLEKTDPLKILSAILLPPVGVGLGLHFWLNILLTLLGYVPGSIHAVYVILTP